MTILDQVKKYYQTNSSDLETFLETPSFLDINAKYPKSVVIKFGTTKLIGEISVWQHDHASYLEFEYADLTKPDNEPVSIVKNINTDSICDELKKQFELLRKLSSKHILK